MVRPQALKASSRSTGTSGKASEVFGMGAALWAVVCAAEPVCSPAGVCGVAGTVLLSACAGSSVSGCTVSAAGAVSSAITATLPKLVQKLSAASSALQKRSPIPTEPGWLLVSFFIVTLPFERGHTQCALFAICQLQYSTPVLAKPLQISAFGAIFSKFFIFFQRQQTRFFVNAARVACQAAVCADNTVAGYDEGNRVVPDRAAHGLRGHFGKAAFRRQPGGQCTVGCGLPIRNLTQQRPYLLPEGRAAGVQRRGEIRLLPAEVDIQPAFCLQKGRCSFGPVRRVQSCRKVFCAVKPQPGQANFIRRQQDAAQGGIIMLCVLHRFHLTD